MTVLEVTTLALTLMHQWGLTQQGWTFGFNRRKKALGLCKFTVKAIELSSHFVQANNHEAVSNTILHEIAHALAGPAAGHGPVWRAWARKVGATTERCNSTATMPKGDWQAACKRCERVHHMHRKPRRILRCLCHHQAPTLAWVRKQSETTSVR